MVAVRSGRIEHRRVIVDESVPLPERISVRVSIEVVELPDRAPRTDAHFAREPFFGIWADRADMADSVEWVNGPRDAWQQRITRSG